MSERHIVLSIEIPAMGDATCDWIDKLRKELDGEIIGDSDSDFILNCLGEPRICKVTTEVSGEKDSDVIEVWGSIRSASIEPASKGYGPGPLTEDQLEANAGYKLNPDYEEVDA